MKKENCLAYSLMKDHHSDLYGYAPAYEGVGTEELVYAFDDYRSYYVYEHGAGEKDFLDYCKKLENEGFELYSSKKSNGNLFSTYTDGDNIVNVAFVSYKDIDKYIVRDVSYVLISVDSVRNSTLPCKAEAYEKITTVQVTTNSVGFIVRLEDGRFLVIDGHVGADEHVDLIYEELCRQNVRGGKPVVAAWLFSHAHGDHVGAFIGILNRYSEDIEVQTVVHNFPGESLYMPYKNHMEGIPNSEGEKMSNRSRDIYRLMKEKVPNGRYVIAHVGQTFEYPGVKFEVVMTSEHLYNKQMIDTNMSSVVYLLTMPGGKLLALGDAVDAAAKIMRNIHGKELKSDVVVIAHHSYNGGDEEMYYNTGAKAVIWSNTLDTMIRRNLIGAIANHFDTNSVKYNFIRPVDEKLMTLREGMTSEEIERFAPKLEMEKRPDVCYESRKTPKNFLPTELLFAGYGNAPRYYGEGEETETLVMNPAEKTYIITINGVTLYNFDYYYNSLKRDGYVSMEEHRDKDDDGYITKRDEREEFARYAIFADTYNEVQVYYADGVLTIKVGPAGKNVLDYETMTVKGGKRVMPE